MVFLQVNQKEKKILSGLSGNELLMQMMHKQKLT